MQNWTPSIFYLNQCPQFGWRCYHSVAWKYYNLSGSSIWRNIGIIWWIIFLCMWSRWILFCAFSTVIIFSFALMITCKFERQPGFVRFCLMILMMLMSKLIFKCSSFHVQLDHSLRDISPNFSHFRINTGIKEQAHILHPQFAANFEV